MADMVSAYLRKGQLAFARRCRTGRAFEVYRKKFNNDQWHAVRLTPKQLQSLTAQTALYDTMRYFVFGVHQFLLIDRQKLWFSEKLFLVTVQRKFLFFANVLGELSQVSYVSLQECLPQLSHLSFLFKMYRPIPTHQHGCKNLILWRIQFSENNGHCIVVSFQHCFL